MSAPNLFSLLQSIAAKHPDLVAANTLAAAAQIVHEFVEAARAADPNWGYISKIPGETQYEGRSQDSAAYGQANPISVKLISGAGDPHAMTLVWVEGGALRTTDHWLYPDSASFGATPVPVSTPAPPPDLSGLLADVIALKARVSALENAPAPPPPHIDLSAYAKHGDAVSVTGHMLLNFYGLSLKTQDATLTGTITK